MKHIIDSDLSIATRAFLVALYTQEHFLIPETKHDDIACTVKKDLHVRRYFDHASGVTFEGVFTDQKKNGSKISGTITITLVSREGTLVSSTTSVLRDVRALYAHMCADRDRTHNKLLCYCDDWQ